MSTPVHVFVEIAARHGDVDPDDMRAVQTWYLEEVRKLPPETIGAIIEELVERDGEASTGEYARAYPADAPIPSLGHSPRASLAPAGVLRRLLLRLFGR